MKENEAQDGKDGILILSDELSYFGVLLQDLFGAEAMGFLLVGVYKISSFGHRSIYGVFGAGKLLKKCIPAGNWANSGG